jgi:hypothetical protein
MLEKRSRALKNIWMKPTCGCCRLKDKEKRRPGNFPEPTPRLERRRKVAPFSGLFVKKRKASGFLAEVKRTKSRYTATKG